MHEEIKMTAADLDIDDERIMALDHKMLQSMIEDCGSPEEMKKRKKEMSEGCILKTAYDILQDYNQMEIAFFVMAILGSTLNKNMRVQLNKGRMHYSIRKAEGGDEKAAPVASMVGASLLRDCVL